MSDPTMHPSSVPVVREEMARLLRYAADINKRVTETELYREMSGWAAELALLVEDVLGAQEFTEEMRETLRATLRAQPEEAMRRAVAGARALAELEDVLEALDLAGVAARPLALAADFDDGQLVPVVTFGPDDVARWRDLVRLGDPPENLERATHEEIGGAAAALLDRRPDLVETEEGQRLVLALVAGDYREAGEASE